MTPLTTHCHNLLYGNIASNCSSQLLLKRQAGLHCNCRDSSPLFIAHGAHVRLHQVPALYHRPNHGLVFDQRPFVRHDWRPLACLVHSNLCCCKATHCCTDAWGVGNHCCCDTHRTNHGCCFGCVFWGVGDLHAWEGGGRDWWSVLLNALSASTTSAGIDHTACAAKIITSEACRRPSVHRIVCILQVCQGDVCVLNNRQATTRKTCLLTLVTVLHSSCGIQERPCAALLCCQPERQLQSVKM